MDHREFVKQYRGTRPERFRDPPFPVGWFCGCLPELRAPDPFISAAMAKTDTHTVARLLREYAQRTSLRGGNPYRAKAFLRAADSLSALSQPLDRVIAAGTLTEIPGIGEPSRTLCRSSIRRDRIRALKSFERKCPRASLNYSRSRDFGPTRYSGSIRSSVSPRLPGWRPPQRKTASARSKALAQRSRQKSCKICP
jgi:hypothetical protein